MKKFTFRKGGIHPAEHKFANDKGIEDFPLPKQAVVFLSQHIGAPAVPVVAKGDQVKVGQLIGKAEAFVCANVHSPVSGTVAKIEEALTFNGYKKMAVFIDVEGDEFAEGIDTSDTLKKEITLNKEEIIDRIKSCGIVGLGGACFPTHIKFMLPPEKKADFLIINAAECEPYITSDQHLMEEKTEECIVGVQALLIASGAPEARIGVEENKPEAIAKIREILKDYPDIHLYPLKTKYPQGSEKQLIKSMTGREVPNGKLPIDAGCIVNNIATAYAVYEAVQKNKPLIETYTTITGKSLANKRNFKIRIGTPMQEVLDCVGIPENTGKILCGGPMMGRTMSQTNCYFAKGMSSILFMDEKESRRPKASNCLHCGHCVEACVMGLEPNLLHALAEQRRYEECEKNHIMNCIECGCCQYVCPAHRPILDLQRVAKMKVGEMIRNRKK